MNIVWSGRTLIISLAAATLLSMAAFFICVPLAHADTETINFESGYTLNSVNGQNGWNSTGPYDQSVVDTSAFGSPSGFGTKAFRISNAVTSGSFGDQTFAPPLTDAVGEMDATDGTFSEGIRQNHYELQFDFTSATSTYQSGLAVSISPDRGDGSRMAYIRLEDHADGVHVYFDDVQGTSNPANFVETDLATLDRTTVHTIKMTFDPADGPSNDVVKVYIDGALVHVGTSWENYYRYDSEAHAEQSPRIVKTVIFRAGGTAAPSTLGDGFLFDNITLTSEDVSKVTTGVATGITRSDATLNGAVGPFNAMKESFWVSTSTFATSSSNIPANVYSTPVLPAAGGGATFSDPLSLVTTNGIVTGGVNQNMPAITPGTTYYYVAWADIGGIWYPGDVHAVTTAPDAPTLLTPASGTTLETNSFDFTWNAVTDALPVTYQFQSSLNPAATGGVLTSGLWTSGTLTSPLIHSSGAHDGTWYWQVRAQDANGTWGPWSAIWNMTIDTAAVTTNAASPVADTSATLNGINGPTDASNTSFWWGTTPISGTLVAGTDPGSSEFPASGWQHDPGLGAATAGASLSEPLTGLTAGTTYYFVAWSYIGGTWYPGGVQSFTTTGATPTPSATTNLANPIDATGATLNGTNGGITAGNTSFWWGTASAGPFTPDANPGATEFPVSGWQHDLGLGTAAANAPFSERLTGLTTGIKYYFTAWSLVGGTWYPGTVQSFTTRLESPTITSPLDGTATTTAALQQVTWTTVSGTGVTYIYQSSASNVTNGDGSFTSPAYTSGLLGTTYIATAGTPPATYYLHVMAKDSTGNTSAWSSIVEVHVVASSSDLVGHLVIVKKTTNSSAADFSFDVGSATIATTTVDVSTDATGVGTSTTTNLAPDTYNVIENPQSDWVLQSVSCDKGSLSSITGGEAVNIQTGVTTTCIFTNEPVSTDTELVYQGALATSTTDALTNPSKWFFYNDTTDAIDDTLGGMVTGPGAAPLGVGSVQFTLAASPLDRKNVATYQFAGMKLAEVTAFSYAAYSHSGVASATESPFFNFNVDLNGSNAWQGRLVYVPSANMASVPQDAWNTFNMISNGSALWTWSHYASNGNKWPDGNTNEYRTWSDIMSSFPNATVLASDPWLGIRVGEPGPASYTGNIDDFSVTVNDGSYATTTIADFEPDVSTETAITNVSPEPSTVGSPYTVSWSVTPDSGSARPTGTVTVTVNGGAGCSAAASAGSCEITPTSPGTVTLVALFDGNPGFNSSDSAATTVTHEIDSAPVVKSSVITGGGNGPVVGGGGIGVGGQVLGASIGPAGKVLGASTSNVSCSAIVTSYLGQGHQNDPVQVKSLQTFLNDEVSPGLPITGYFGPLTAAAVSTFQLKYWQDVLAPWVPYGLPTDHTTTGFVGKTTEWKINMLVCPSLGLPTPSVP